MQNQYITDQAGLLLAATPRAMPPSPPYALLIPSPQKKSQSTTHQAGILAAVTPRAMRSSPPYPLPIPISQREKRAIITQAGLLLPLPGPQAIRLSILQPLRSLHLLFDPLADASCGDGLVIGVAGVQTLRRHRGARYSNARHTTRSVQSHKETSMSTTRLLFC